MTDFHFLRPWWFLALLPLAGTLWFMARQRLGASDWRAFCDPELLPHILLDAPASQSRLPVWLAGLTGMLAILALAGPVWERLPAPVFRNLSAMVIVLDLSWAMEATDVKPGRLERARFKINDLLRARKDGQTALVAYAGDAFVVAPLTDDTATIAAQLMALTPGVMPVQGTRMDLGLEAAAKLLRQAGQKTGDVLLVTAGEAVRAAASEAERLQQQGYRVSAIGIGSRDGAPVPLPDGGFLKDGAGRLAVSRLDIKALWDLAQAGGGVYRTLDNGSADTDAVLDFVDRRAEAEQQGGQEVHVDQWREGGIWLLPLLALFGALGFRRGWLGLWLLAALLPAPRFAEALDWNDLWRTPDQQAQQALQAGDARAAAERFENPAWKAAAEYQAGEFGQAAQRLEALDTPAAHYNRGNALARDGRLEEALKAYDRALAQAPGDEDAQENRRLVEKALEEQKQQQQDQKKQQQDSSEQSQDQDGGQGQQQDGQDGQQKPAAGQQPPAGAQQEPPPGADGQDGEAKPGEAASPPKPADPSGDRPGEKRADPPKPGQSRDTPSGADQAETQPQPAGADQPGKPGQDKPDQPSAAPAEARPDSEGEQAEAQWLRRIPDDPGGLLKRKFSYQYRLRQQQQHNPE